MIAYPIFSKSLDPRLPERLNVGSFKYAFYSPIGVGFNVLAAGAFVLLYRDVSDWPTRKGDFISGLLLTRKAVCRVWQLLIRMLRWWQLYEVNHSNIYNYMDFEISFVGILQRYF